MKEIVSVLLAALLISATAIGRAKEVPTESQIKQLFESVSRTSPDKVRVISLHIKETAPPSKDEIKSAEDSMRKMQEKIQEGVPEPIKTKRIEENVRLRTSVMTGVTYNKCEEWKSGSLYRLDKAIGWHSLDEAENKTNYDTTYINLEDAASGAVSTVTINHDTKSFETRTGKGSLWAEVGAYNIMTAESRVSFIVALILASKESINQKAQDENRKVLIDSVKLKQLLSGTVPLVDVSVEEKVVDGRRLLGFEMHIQGAAVLIDVEATNYNRIAHTEIRAKDGQLTLSSYRKDFDSQDFPHHYVLITRQEGVYTTNTFLIKEIELNAHFSDEEVFRFAPPKNYGVVDMSSGVPKIESYPGGVKPSRTINISTPIKEQGWYESPVVIRTILLVVLLLPPLIVLVAAIKKWKSK